MKTDGTTGTMSAEENADARRREKLARENEARSRQEGINRGVIFASIIGFAILLISGIIVYSVYKRDHNSLLSQMEAQKVTFSNTINSRDSVIGEWITTFADIEKNIAMIKEKQHIISINASNNELARDKKKLIVEDITYINTLLEQNKMKIALLTSQLNKSNGSITLLNKKIAELEESVKLSEGEISELKNSLVGKNFEIAQLNEQNTSLQSTIVQKDEKITNQTHELNKAFFACGTYKQLKAKGLLTKEGGFIGLGKSKSLLSNFSDSAFVQIDRVETKSIPVNSKSAKLLSEHPSSSYQYIRDKDKRIASIEISDPESFWKISKYAVVVITN